MQSNAHTAVATGINPATAINRVRVIAESLADAATAIAPDLADRFWQDHDAETAITATGGTEVAALAMLRLSMDLDALRLEGAMAYLATGSIAEAVETDAVEEERHDAAVAVIREKGAEPCNCEHSRHWADSAARHGIAHDGHRHLEVPAGSRRAAWIGAVCDDCAEQCVAPYLV